VKNRNGQRWKGMRGARKERRKMSAVVALFAFTPSHIQRRVFAIDVEVYT
jgi:hypothetical protein